MKRSKTLRCSCPCGFIVEGDPESAAALFLKHHGRCPSLPAYMRQPSAVESTLDPTDKIRSRSWPWTPSDAA